MARPALVLLANSSPAPPSPLPTNHIRIIPTTHQGLFEVGNIILDEVKNGGKEARQVVQQDTGELRDFFKRKVR